MNNIDIIIEWLNNNAGFISVLIFIVLILIGWSTGFFKLLKNKPKLRIEIIEHSFFGSIIDLKWTYKNFPVNKTAFAIYLRVTNVGRAASSIGKIKLGYFKSDFSYRIFSKRNWFKEIISKEDFKIEFENSDKIKVYPFLKQHNQYFQNNNDTFLPVGKSMNGMVYFEQDEAYGSWMPRLNNDKETTNLKIIIKDSFNKNHSKKFDLKLVEPNYAFKFNPLFGQTQKEYFNTEEKTQPLTKNIVHLADGAKNEDDTNK